MTVSCRLLISAWQAASLPRWHAFRRALDAPRRTQERMLLDMVATHRETWFGRRHGFSTICDAEDYRRRVPLADWDDYAEAVDRIRGGERGVLTGDSVRRLVPSSGSSAARKLVPYTRGLLRRFQAGVAPWIVDLYGRWPRLKSGPAYWSVSPSIRDEDPAARVPIGFDDDSAYLGRGLEGLVARTLAVPPEVRLLSSPAAFRHLSALFLLARSDLRLVSVWHPSFFVRLLEHVRENWPVLLSDLERGALAPVAWRGTGPSEGSVVARLAARLRPEPERAARLARVGRDDPAGWWPELGLVSCWSDGPAELGAARLKCLLPAAELQPKGLVATEAIVSLPFGGHYPLAVRSHFFEFIDDGDRMRLVDELETGDFYSVVVTNGGGLYRYRLRDRVQVTGHLGSTPCLRFVGKEETVSDQRGEKLNGVLVGRALRRACARVEGLGWADLGFAMLAPEGCSDGAMRYVLFVELGDAAAPRLPALAEALDRLLCENPHYELCRRLDQLDAVGACRVRRGAAVFLRRRQQAGKRLGDIKPVWLSPQTGWRDWFELSAPLTPPATRTRRRPAPSPTA